MAIETLTQLFDTIEQSALRTKGNSQDVRARKATVAKWLAEVVCCPVDWRERVNAIPPGDGVDYALALINAAAGKRVRLQPPPPVPQFVI